MTPTFQERHFDYVLGPNQDARLASVAAGTTLTGLELNLDTDAPFLLRSRAVRQKYTVADPPTQNGLQFLKMRWSGPMADYRQQQLVSVASEMSYFGQVGNFKPEFPNVNYPAGGVLTVDIYNSGASAITNLMLFFRGVKLYPLGSVPGYTYPSRMALSSFPGYQFTNAAGGALTALGASERRENQYFTVKQDADFVIRGIQATAPFNAGGSEQFSEVFLRLFDFNKKPYSNDYIPLDILAGAGGFPQGFPVGPTPSYLTPFGAGAGSPGLFYPEIYLPANHQLVYNLLRTDGTYGATEAQNLVINLIGSKVFPQ